MREIKFQNEELPKKYIVNGWLLTVFPNSYKQHGYVKRKVEGHPNADKRGYVMEHRLVVEMAMGQPLPKNAIIHHKNGTRDDNRLDNLEYMVEQERHAKHHAKDLRRNRNGQYVASDPIFGQIKFRLFNKNTGLTETHTLAKLIATTYRKSQFEFRGRFTGLKDKKGVEIYEGDILQGYNKDGSKYRPREIKIEEFLDYDGDSMGFGWSIPHDEIVEIIGNRYENPELLTT